MIRRPLTPRFNAAVLADIKTTTIRDKPWPIGVPIMFYNWSGLPYRSKQIVVCPIIVEDVGSIEIANLGEKMWFMPSANMTRHTASIRKTLHGREGFNSRAEMDDWFRPLVKPGTTLIKAMMRFHRI